MFLKFIKKVRLSSNTGLMRAGLFLMWHILRSFMLLTKRALGLFFIEKKKLLTRRTKYEKEADNFLYYVPPQ
jgi:hypothetical protein